MEWGRIKLYENEDGKMPIKTQSELPAKEILESENIFVMDETRSLHQDIRPLKILILNNMPVKQDTELQLLRALSNTPLQVEVTLMNTMTHVSLNTPQSHLNKFYTTFDKIRDDYFDGLIITGAPVEDISFEEVSTFYCWYYYRDLRLLPSAFCKNRACSLSSVRA